MKKVLILTSIYPGPDIPNTFTPVVHYFAKEWCNDVTVKVIHNVAYYPRLFYLFSFLFSKFISTITGTNIPSKRLNYDLAYNYENVDVYRLPMFKAFPKFKFSDKVLKKQISKILNQLKKSDFIPDHITGHWWNPQLELLSMLKKEFPKSTTTLVMHSEGDALLDLHKARANQLINSIDVFGYRSLPIKQKFESLFGIQKNSFMCYSGIPEKLTRHKFHKKFNSELNSFLFVGVLMKRKFPSEIIESLNTVYTKQNFTLDYIGEGHEKRKIESKAKQLGLSENVHLHGELSRDEVWDKMSFADCFVMISENEAFGLVYLEAMAAGCITIASIKEGFDGVIIDGFNGFLCEAGNIQSLSETIKKINELSIQEKKEISNNAIFTASKFTNFKTAHNYLNSLNLL